MIRRLTVAVPCLLGLSALVAWAAPLTPAPDHAGPQAAPAADKPATATSEGLFFSIGGVDGREPDGRPREAEFGTIAISPDGRTWQTVFRGGQVTENFSHSNNNLIRGLAAGHGRYVAVGNPGVGILVSDDGRNWRHVTKFGDGLNGFNVCFGNGVFVIARAGDLLRSPDGLTWTRHATPVEGRRVFGEGGLGHMRQVVFGNGVFVCLGDSRIAVTRDGKAYDHVAFHSGAGPNGRQALVFGAGRFLWLSSVGHQISRDGVTWQPLVIGDADTPTARTTQAISTLWTGERFLVGGPPGQVYESPDGLTWTRLDAQGNVRPLAAGGGLVVGRGAVSADAGKTWTRVEAGVPQREIVYWSAFAALSSQGGR